MSEESYNGWSNRETWALVLHLSATVSVYDEINETLHVNLSHRFYLEDLLYEVTIILQDWVEEKKASVFLTRDASDEIVSMVEDVGSFYRIDWGEVALACVDEFLGGCGRYLHKYHAEA